MEQSLEMNERGSEQWHLNKSIPVALISIVFLQTATVVWWASGIEADVQLNTSARITAQEATQDLKTLFARLDVTLQNLTEQLEDARKNQETFRNDISEIKSGQAVIESKIDQINED